MSLVEYHRKRDFKKTAEPRGARAAKGAKLSFAVQKHAATHLHYDFRLELDGALKSWAVPKGPSLDPRQRRLAVHVEDHPLEYGGFEGTIPQGEYGGGAVLLWDRGRWTPIGDARAGYRSGKLKFHLAGEKLRGDWTLVRMHGEGEKNWLLIKEKDDLARAGDGAGIVEREVRSVLSGKTIEQIAHAGGIAPKPSLGAAKSKAKSTVKRIVPSRAGARARAPATPALEKEAAAISPSELAAVPGAKRGSMPTELQPQLATLAKAAPAGDGWLHEIKFDGYRILAFVQNGRARLMTRNGHDWSHRFGSVAAALKTLPAKNAILDGEVVVLRPDGTHDFQALQNALRSGGKRGGGHSPLTYCVFDLPYLDGFDLRGTPLLERKRVLQALLDSRGVDQRRFVFSAHVRGQGPALLPKLCGLALEGLISKRIDAPYESARTRSWLKVKCVREQEFVVGGYTDPGGTRQAFGALLVGYYQDGKLRYSGKVGTGFDDAELKRLHKRMGGLAVGESPFADAVPRPDARHAHWVRPELVAQLTFTEWTSDGRLRHPSYIALREDKDPEMVTREMPEPLPADARPAGPAAMNGRARRVSSGAAKHGQAEYRLSVPPKAPPQATPTVSPAAKETVMNGVRLTSPGKVLYPEQRLTKLDLAEYYTKVAKWMLPHVAGRPLSLLRCPEGRQKACFFQKHVTDQRTRAMHAVTVREKQGKAEYVYIRDEQGLLSLVQMGVLEIHIWGSRADRYERPDRMVFDLDPDPSVPFSDVIAAARLMRERLEKLDLVSFVKTTGGKGLHVVAPLQRRASWDQVRAFSEAFSRHIVAEFPQRFVATMSKAKRVGRIFIDYLRNGQGATWIAPYSTRAREHAPVSVPLTWDELTPTLRSDQLTVTNIDERLRRLKRDPWAGIDALRQSLSAKLLNATDS